MNQLGQTQSFVLAQGFQAVGENVALTGHDGRARLFAEFTADPDRPDVHPQEAYQALLSSLQPGWQLRMLQIYWPDPLPRQTFLAHVEQWPFTKGRQFQQEGLDLLRQGIVLCAQEQALPFLRRTFLEFVYPGEEGQAWWEGAAGMMQNFGVTFRPISFGEILALADQIFNPVLD